MSSKSILHFLPAKLSWKLNKFVFRSSQSDMGVTYYESQRPEGQKDQDREHFIISKPIELQYRQGRPKRTDIRYIVYPSSVLEFIC